MSNSTSTVRVGIIGLGTVGGGTVRLIQKHHDRYLKAFGVDLKIQRACARNPRHVEELGLDPQSFTTDWHEVTQDENVDIVVELIGGTSPAREIILDAFAHGKHVVSANKALLAQSMDELAGAAHDNGCALMCEAACAGGIPIVNALEHALAANGMSAVAGIMNGTTNYILTRMDEEGLSFEEVLADAQELGYAEAEPSADVDGYDAAAKLAILASIAFQTRVTLDDVRCEGIRTISAQDMELARQMGMRIKLLGVAQRVGDDVAAHVWPALVPEDHQLAMVDGAMNAVVAVGDGVGETLFYGAGAGAFPTGSAVMGDILALARPLAHGIPVAAEPEPFARELDVVPAAEAVCARLLSFVPASDDDLAAVAAHLPELSLDACTEGGAEEGPATIVTEPLTDAEASELAAFVGVHAQDRPRMLRVEDPSRWGAERPRSLN